MVLFSGLGSHHYLEGWEGYRILREGYRIPVTANGRGTEFLSLPMGGVQNSCHLWREGFRIPAQGGTVFPRKAGGTQSSCAKREGRRFLAIMIWRILPLRMQENAPFYTYISKFSRGSNPRPPRLGWWGAHAKYFPTLVVNIIMMPVD